MSRYDLTFRSGTVVTEGQPALQAALAQGHQRRGLALEPADGPA